MKKFLLFTGFLLFVAFSAFSQYTIIFHENFEFPSLGDSVTSTQEAVPGVDDWGNNIRLHQGIGSLRCDSCQVKTGKTTYLTSPTFSTVGNTNVELSFGQICKVDPLDIATIEVSSNGGTSWTQLTGVQYLSSGSYGGNGNKFTAGSYGAIWSPSTPATLPLYTWWRTEKFDVSMLIGNCPTAKFRFKLADEFPPGPGGNPPNVKNNRGWYVDNLSVKMSYSELLPPTISLTNPVFTGVTYNVGPYKVRAKVYDFSGLDTVMLVYSLNNGANDTLGMTFQSIDTNWVAYLPVMADSGHVCYYVIAYDASPSHNFASYPVTPSCTSLTFYAPFVFPYNDNFDAANSLWTAGPATSSSVWQWGTPNYGTTNSAHSPPKAWDVNLTTAYANNANCWVMSPPLNFTNAFNARLSFWYNYNTNPMYDGFRLEYTIDGGITWSILGTQPNPDPDTLGVNWYTNTIYTDYLPAWEGNSNGWQQAKYKLSILNYQTNYVRFRFLFKSYSYYTPVAGASIDDFSIVLPAPQEAATDKVLTPVTGCGLGLETVSIRIINSGTTPINGGLTASYKRDAFTSAVTESVPDSIPPGGSIIFTFTTPVDLSTVGADANFNLKCWVTLTGDPNHGDDTIFKAITSQYIPNPPAVSSTLITYGTSTTITATSTLPVTWYSDCSSGTLLSSVSTYTTPVLYGMMVYYPQVMAPNFCWSSCAHDTVYVSSPPPFDGSTLTINTPVTGFNLLTPQTVEVTVRNYGATTLTSFFLKYKVSGPINATVSEAYNGSPIASGATATFTFAAPASMQIYGTYNFKAWVEVAGDVNQINDTAYAVVENKMFHYCVSSANSTSHNDIGNVTVSNLNNGNATPSLNDTLSVKKYTDFTTLSPILMSVGLTYPFSVSQIEQDANFYTCYVKVFVDWNWNGTFEEATETAFVSGATSSINNPVTGNITVPLNAHLGITRFRVVLMETNDQANVHACGTYSWGETEDYLVLVSPQPQNDAGVIAITAPPVIYPEGTTSGVNVTVKNFGSLPIAASTMNVSYQIDNNPVVTQLYTSSLISGQTAPMNFGAITLPVGSHEICAWTTLSIADLNSFNDTTCKAIYGIPIDPLPYYDNFDTMVNFTTTPSIGTNWIHGIPTPTVFPNNAHSGSYIWGTNLNIAGGYGNNANCSLVTQIFTFNNAMNAKLSFWMKRNTEANYDGCVLEYSKDGGYNWLVLGTAPTPGPNPVPDPLGINWYNGPLNAANPVVPGWSGIANQWIKATYKLSIFNAPWQGQVRFRYRFISDVGITSSGMFIDDFEIFKPYMTDAGIDSIYTPNGTDAAGYPGHVKVRLRNFSRVPLTSVNISYKIGNQAAVTELWTGNIAPDEAANYTFITTYGIPQGNYCLKAYTSLPNDSVHVNDTMYRCAFGIPVYAIPYTDQFDSLVSFWYTEGTQWERGTPSGTPASINAPYSAPNCWKTKITGPYAKTGQPDYLFSPMFNLSYGYDSITFFHWVDIYNNDKASVEYLAVDGSGTHSWKKLGIMGDPNGVNWYNSGPNGFVGNGGAIPGWQWHRSSFDLKILNDIANPAQFRFNFQCYYPNTHTPVNAGWAIDNFELTTPRIPEDAGVVNIVQPATSVTYGTTLDVKIKIRNFGTATLFTIPLKFSVNGTTVAAETWTGILLADSTVDYTFPSIEAPLASFDLCAYTDVPFDTKLDNDTSCRYISVVAPPFDVSITEIITPQDTTIHNNQATVKVKVKNLGFQPVTSIPLQYRVGGNNIVVDETWTGNLTQNQEEIFTFTQTYGYEYLGWYYLCIMTNLPNDGYRANDTLCAKIDEKWTFITENSESGLFMAQSYPNPCDQSAEIEYKVPGAGEVTFNLTNYLGQRLMVKSEKVTQGEHKFIVNTSKLPQGLYYYYIEYEGKRMIRKMVVTH